MPSVPLRMIGTWISQNDRERDRGVARHRGPAGPRRARPARRARARRSRSGSRTSRTRRSRAASPGRWRRARRSSRGTAPGKEMPYLRAGVRVEDHRHQHDGVAEEDRDHRLPPVHPLLHQAGGERVGGDHDAHPDPERGDVVGGPGAPLRRRRREVRIPERAAGQVLRAWKLSGPSPRSRRTRRALAGRGRWTGGAGVRAACAAPGARRSCAAATARGPRVRRPCSRPRSPRRARASCGRTPPAPIPRTATSRRWSPSSDGLTVRVARRVDDREVGVGADRDRALPRIEPHDPRRVGAELHRTSPPA